MAAKAPRIFFDMDGVIVDFERTLRCLNMANERFGQPTVTADEYKRRDGAYMFMTPVPDALEGLQSAIGMGYDCWLATKPPTGIAYAYRDKAKWVFEHAPEMKRKLIITHHKGLLGGANDILVDDRPHKAECAEFQGLLVVFGRPQIPAANDVIAARDVLGMQTTIVDGWPQLLTLLRSRAPRRAALKKAAELMIAVERTKG